ncbi:MAG TPA: amidase [Tahibacter sp.]|nr:amidase [Tahibacter sp.]
MTIAAAALSVTGCATAPPATPPAPVDTSPTAPFSLHEAGIAELQRRMESKELTARTIVQLYLDRIARLDDAGPELSAVIEINPDALTIADALDAERAAGKVRGPLHGVPVLLKDTIDTADAMQTSAGSLALVGTPAAQDAAIVERLRKAGAVVLGKTNLSEWSNFRSTRSTSGWSARGGQTRNPYVLDRNPCGSSSGSAVAVAANLAVVAVGTETDGSILCPAANAAIVGLKPTVGLVSRSGTIPLAPSLDTPGPMARSVTDTAVLLNALAGSDSRDKASWDADKHATDYTRGLAVDGLRGVRVGVVRDYAEFNADVAAAFEKAIARMLDAGAALVDPVKLPNAGKLDALEMTVWTYEFKTAVNAYLATRRGVPIANLSELIAWNRAHPAQELGPFGQELLEQAQASGTLNDRAYKQALASLRRYARKDGVDAAMKKYKIDVLVVPSNNPSWVTDPVNGDRFTAVTSTIAAAAGYPSITVPLGDVRGLPIGLTFIGPAWSEAKLLRYAYAFEQATKARRPPAFLPTIASGASP